MTAARGEWLKLATLPAVPLTVALTWAVTALLRLAPAADPIAYARAGFVVLGVLAATSEYAGGQVRTTLTCTPRRAALHAVKAVVLALATAPVAVVTVALADTGNPVHLVLVTVLGAAVGTVLRHALAAVTVLLGYYYAVGPLLAGRVDDSVWLPAAWAAGAQAAAVVTFVRRDASPASPPERAPIARRIALRAGSSAVPRRRRRRAARVHRSGRRSRSR